MLLCTTRGNTCLHPAPPPELQPLLHALLPSLSGCVWGLGSLVSTVITLGSPHQSLEAYPFGRVLVRGLSHAGGQPPCWAGGPGVRAAQLERHLDCHCNASHAYAPSMPLFQPCVTTLLLHQTLSTPPPPPAHTHRRSVRVSQRTCPSQRAAAPCSMLTTCTRMRLAWRPRGLCAPPAAPCAAARAAGARHGHAVAAAWLHLQTLCLSTARMRWVSRWVGCCLGRPERVYARPGKASALLC